MSFLNTGMIAPIDPRVMARTFGVGLKHLAGTAKAPLDWYNAIAGAGQRGVATSIAEGGLGDLLHTMLSSENKGIFTSRAANERAGKDVARVAKSFGAGVRNLNNTAIDRAAENRIGIPGPPGGLVRGVEDFAFETGTDPATIIPGADIISILGRGAKAARLGSRLEEAAPWVRKFADEFIHERGSVHRATKRAGQDVVRGHESAGRNVHTRQDIAHEGLVSEHAEEMDRLNQLPPAVRHTLLQRAYREGSRKVRNLAVKAGYAPSAEEKASPPLGILTSFRDVYTPRQRLHPKPQTPDLAEKLESPYRRIRQLAPKPGFNLPQKVGDESAKLSERVAHRLKTGTRLERYYSTRNKILTDLGLAPAASRPAIVVKKIEEELSRPGGPNEKALRRYRALLGRQHEAVKGGEELRAQTLRPGAPLREGTTIPEDVYNRLFGDVVRPNPGALKDLSDASREALFSVTSLPHKKNISILQALGPAGLPGIIRGSRYAKQIKQASSVANPTKRIGANDVTRIQFKANRRAGQEIGSQYEVHPLTEEFYKKHSVGPPSMSFEDYLGEVARPENLGYRPTHAVLVNGQLTDVASHKQVEEYFNHPTRSGYSINVDAFSSPEAKFWGTLDDEASAHITPTNFPKHLGAAPESNPTLKRVKQLEGIGGTEHFIRNPESDSPFASWKGPGIGHVGRWLARRGTTVGEALDRFDTGQRLALQDALAKRGTTGFNAGGQIRDVLGDYKSKTELVDFLRNRVGAPFPQWHLGIVPKAIGKAMVENPNATHMLARGENLANTDVMQPMFGADLHVGGPLDEGLQFWNMPFGLAQYLGSQSDTGPLGEAHRDIGSLAKGNAASVASDLFRTYVPGGGLVEDVTSTSNFKGPGSPAATAGLDLFGSYLTKAKKPKPATQLRQNLRERMEIQGVPKPAIDMMMKKLQLGPRLPSSSSFGP